MLTPVHMSSCPTLPASECRPSRAERTRGQILEAAGQDVGIGRSAVLYHFKDKKLLYRAVLDDLF